MNELPVGTVTFVFTDVEGSTRLLKRLGTGYASLLLRHRELVRRAAQAEPPSGDGHSGRGILPSLRPGEGRRRGCGHDSAFAHDDEAWPEGADVRVRIGMHTSEPQLSNDRYVGLGVHRAARICAVGHGGQVLASRSTAGLVDEEEQPWNGVPRSRRAPAQGSRSQRTDLPARGRWPVSGLSASQVADGDRPRGGSGASERHRHVPRNGHRWLGSSSFREVGAETAGLVLDEYEHILRAATEEEGGRVLELAGDSFISAFTRATGSSDTAAAWQQWRRSLTPDQAGGETSRRQDQPPHQGRLPRGTRAMHAISGSPCLAPVPRLRGLRPSGQILFSGSTESVLDPATSDAYVIRDLGTRQLDDFDRPVRLYELVI